MVGLAEARHDEAAPRQFRMPRHRLMRLAVVDHVLVDLVRQQQDIGACQQLRQLAHVFLAPDRAGRVVRRVDQDHARARRDRGREAVERNAEVRRVERDRHRLAAGQFDRRQIAVVARLQHDHFVARMDRAQDRGQQRLCRAGGHRDFAVGVVGAAIELADLVRDGLAQLRHAGHRRVLVQAALHRARDRVDDLRIAVEVRKALAQVDRILLGGERGHHGEDGGAHVGQAGRGRAERGVGGHGVKDQSSIGCR